MIAVETNLLVYAHRRDSPWHDAAQRVLAQLASSRAAWAIPWSCLHEFVGIVTHPRIYSPPSTREEALDQVRRAKRHTTRSAETVVCDGCGRGTARIGECCNECGSLIECDPR